MMNGMYRLLLLQTVNTGQSALVVVLVTGHSKMNWTQYYLAVWSLHIGHAVMER